MRYILLVNSTSLTPEEVRAAAETHQELGPDYQAAVIESFIDKVGKEIDARVDARLAMSESWAQAPARRQRSFGKDKPFSLAVLSLIIGVPITGIEAGNHTGIGAIVISWLGIAAINVAYTVANRRPPEER
jgi:hypothetical protein